MKKLTRQEQETIILYNQAEAMAEIYTHDPVLQNKLKNRSEIAKLKCENEFGGQTYVLPKRYLSILKAKRSEKQIQTSRENIRKAFDKRKRLDFETCQCRNRSAPYIGQRLLIITCVGGCFAVK